MINFPLKAMMREVNSFFHYREPYMLEKGMELLLKKVSELRIEPYGVECVGISRYRDIVLIVST